MHTKDRLSASSLLLACGVIGALLVIAALPAWVQAETSNLPPRPPTATPTSFPTEIRRRPAKPTGAWIELSCQLPPQGASLNRSGLWTAVQWQDTGGEWHDVEGWRGTLDEVANGMGKKVWWVAETDFGTGPFRWVVRRGYGGKWQATSETFHLPKAGGETLYIGAVLTP